MRVIQLTISGKDAGGYIWQNVQHFQTSDDAATQTVLLNAFLDAAELALIDPYTACMNESCVILNLGARVINPTTSYTINRGHNDAGLQAGDPSVGALAGKIGFYPSAGADTSRIFVAGPTTDDFTNDAATDPYLTLLQALGDAFLTFDGTAMPYQFVFGIWSRDTSDFTAITGATAQSSPGVLSKRVRT